ncbi:MULTISPECIES: hypothetical protein [Variovorax]|uniref:hypothetical protein n=1 Tax=Variovorax TaxID=34072 RepID=UPI00285EA146|nr:hypothetical protein [Variovorax sp. 3319]MDR6886132.1 hypothetical protein [Variovorax sp. 3319]
MTQETLASSRYSPEAWDLYWRVMLSALYHQKRERFLDGVDRCAQCVGILGGAAAFSQIIGNVRFGWIPAGLVAIVSAVALCYGPGAKARKHSELARDFKRLHAQIMLAGRLEAGETLNKFNAEVLLLEAQEPGALRCLVRQCENELSEAFGSDGDIRPLTRWDRLWMNVVDLDPSRREKKAANKAKAEALSRQATTSVASPPQGESPQ